MTLKELLAETEYTLVSGSDSTEITALVYDSRKAEPGCAFVCIRGTTSDAHDYIPDAAAKGAAAFIVEKEVSCPEGAAVVRVEDARKALALMSAAWFGHPTRKMTVIGVTGTKGKTTTTYMIRAILEAAGHKTGVVGTNGALIDGVLTPTKNTTPESYTLQSFFAQMAEKGCDSLVMEVSSQGLMMHRVDGIDFDLGVFTNLTPDHIGKNEHADFEEYLQMKSRLFRLCRIGLVNADDPHADRILEGSTCRVFRYGLNADCDYYAADIRQLAGDGFFGVGFDLHQKDGETWPLSVAIPGIFSVYNALAAASAAAVLGVGREAAAEALARIRVDGRMEIVHSSDRMTVVVDYAHNGVAAEALLRTLRDYQPKRLVVVFGCGGNRDPHRRYEMGEAAGKLADLSIVTADNSRYEQVENIIKDIHIGLDPTGGKAVDIPDRREAIRWSIEHAEDGDLIAIIGKGHEDYQEVNGVRTHFLDREEAEKVLQELGLMPQEGQKA